MTMWRVLAPHLCSRDVEGPARPCGRSAGRSGVNSVARAPIDRDGARFGAHRTPVPARLDGFDIGDCTKCGRGPPHRHVPVKPDRSEVYFVTTSPENGPTSASVLVGKGAT